jgi:hypothetical protein
MSTANNDLENVVLTAHFSSCYDHIDLLRMMIGWGVEPLDVMLADSVALSKVINGPDEHADFTRLVAKYPYWMYFDPLCRISDDD